MNRKLYVGNLPYDTTETDLESLFAQSGAVESGSVMRDRDTGRALWWGRCGNTHSAEMLPGDRLVLACSVRPETGNRLVVFDARTPERVLFSTELTSGHGVVWDEARQRLYALGGT